MPGVLEVHFAHNACGHPPDEGRRRLRERSVAVTDHDQGGHGQFAQPFEAVDVDDQALSGARQAVRVRGIEGVHQ